MLIVLTKGQLMGRICNRCNYERRPEDAGPDWKCPQCGRAYLKSGTSGKGPTLPITSLDEKKATGVQPAPVKAESVRKPDRKEEDVPEAAPQPRPVFHDKPAPDIMEMSAPAGFWIRVLAYILDGFIFTGLLIVAFFVLFKYRTLPAFIASALAVLLYKPVMESFFGATIGKFVCGIRVWNRKGENINLFQALIRFLPDFVRYAAFFAAVWILFVTFDFRTPDDLQYLRDMNLAQVEKVNVLIPVQYIASLFFLIDVLVVPFNRRKRALHDMMAGSYCVWNS